MHMYIPGWEVSILKSAVFSDEYGFIVDYLNLYFGVLSYLFLIQNSRTKNYGTY